MQEIFLYFVEEICVWKGMRILIFFFLAKPKEE